MGVRRADRRHELARDLGTAVLLPALAVLAAEFVQFGLGVTRFGHLFLAAVIVAASTRGSRAALFAALISVAAYKLYLDLRTGEETTAAEDIVNAAIFLVVALIAGTLAGRVHDEAAKAKAHAESMELLFKTSRTLSEEDERSFWHTITAAVAQGSGGSAIALDAAGVLRCQSGDVDPDGAVVAFGKRVLQLEEGSRDRTHDGWRACTIPADLSAGVLLWKAQDERPGLETFVNLIVDLASNSMERARVHQEQVRNQAAEEAGKLREALLSSISHDFRSPLAAIIGSSTSLLEYGDKFDEAVRQDLLLNIRDEGEKLNEFVANLLNMIRLQSGVLQPNGDRLQASDVIQGAIERLKRHRGKAPLINVHSDCEVVADPVLFEQAIYNILDNAGKYAATPEGVEITCLDRQQDGQIVIADRGPGLAKEDQVGVFTTFHFARKAGQAKGTGLGLSISRGFIEAMGGTIVARDRSDGQSGLEIAINLPRSAT